MNLFRRVLSAVSPALLLFLTPACAAKEAAAPAAVVKARPALWKIADKDTTIYLFGTIHILPPGIDWYNGPVAKAFESSDTLVTEILEPTDPETQARIANVALADPPRNLREALPADVRKKYEAALASMQLPVSAFDANDPWYAAVALSTLPILKDGFGTMNGAEAQLVSRANGKKHLALETAEQQLGLFDSLPQATQVTYLNEVLDSFPDVRKEILQMVEAWKTGKADDLAKLMNEEESDPLLMKVLLVDRNKAWARWIEQQLKQPGTVFIAVGAGHLAGKDSVQKQLAADGVKTKRMR